MTDLTVPLRDGHARKGKVACILDDASTVRALRRAPGGTLLETPDTEVLGFSVFRCAYLTV